MKAVIIGWSMLFISGAVLWLWELRTPLIRIEYKTEFIKELGAAIISIGFTIAIAYLLAPVVKIMASPFIKESLILTWILSLPLWLRLIIAYLLKDLSYYLAHWAMHGNRFLWNTHNWHHSIQKLWWLASQRTSLSSRFLFELGFLWFPLLEIPPEVMIFVWLHFAVHDNWIHLNVKGKNWMRIVEWVYNTPRFHALHHYHHGAKNLAAVFTFYDRIFGNYVNPDQLEVKEPKVELNSEQITAKMIVGV